jgi:hypothetical protein
MGSEIDLEPALEERLRQRALALGISFNEALTRALLAGLATLDEKPTSKQYVVHARPCGLQPGVDYQKLGGLVDELESDSPLMQKGNDLPG